MRVLVVLIAALCMLSIGLVPLAEEVSADHVYSHRYVIRGRVVDDVGSPVSQAQVQLDLPGWFPRDEGISGQGVCRDGGAQRTADTTWVTATNPTGDYEFCLHGHELQPGGSVEVTVGNVTETGEKDILRRMTLIDVVVPANSTGEEGNMETFSSQVAVVGRLWQPIGGTEGLEGIPVEGVSPVGKQVTMVLTLANGTELTETATTNNYGDFVAIFDTDVDVTGATMTFQTQSAGETIEDTVDVDPGLRAVYHKFIIDKELETNNSPAFGVLAGMLGLVLAVGLVATYRHHRR